jgi:PAS domain S-box-containing protein
MLSVKHNRLISLGENMSKQTNKPVVLVVDDSSTNRFLLKAQLIDDYEVLTANNGNEAIEKATSLTDIDIILLDIMMPEIDGYEVCKSLKQNPVTSAIPIIFITSLDEAENEAHGLQLGAADYIIRPLNMVTVKSRIKLHLDLKRNREKLEKTVQQLKEKETYLKTIMSTIQNGVIISDPETRRIIDVNPFLCNMIGCERKELIGKDYREYLGLGEAKNADDTSQTYVDHSILKTSTTEIIHTRRWFKRAKLGNKDILVQSISDITNIKELLKQQDIDIFQAKRIMNVIHNRPERNINLDNDINLFINFVSCPCHAEGGDHFFIKTLPQKGARNAKTFISLKDQSGHNVGCIIRSITSDLIHRAIIHHNIDLPLHQMITTLNANISKSKGFSLEEFFTSINIKIDYNKFLFQYVSTGHPPFFRIRENAVSIIGNPGDPGTNLPIPMPDFNYEEAEHPLLPGDKYIFFTDGMTDIPLKSGDPALTLEEIKHQIEKIIQTDSALCISKIMKQFFIWLSEKSNHHFIIQTNSNKNIQSFTNKTGDDITVLWIEVETSESITEYKIYPKSVQDVDSFIQSFFQEVMKKCDIFGYQISSVKFRTALTEMILNAWKHGNKEDSNHSITVRLRSGNDLHLEVIDKGEGFDFSNLPDPTEAHNILKTSGRGIFMIRYAANDVFWKGNGNHIVAVFDRELDPEELEEVAFHNDIHLWG